MPADAMLRHEAIAAIYDDIKADPIVTIMGAVAVELYNCGHQPHFFYLEHAMGLASSTGLGLALCLPNRPVTVFDGDGSLLMNLGTLSTMARYHPGNLLHIVFDNESMLSVGGFPTATATGTDLAGIAQASGIRRSLTVHDPASLAQAVREARAARELTTIVAKVADIGPKSFHMDIGLLENRYQFTRAVTAMRRETVRLPLPHQ